MPVNQKCLFIDSAHVQRLDGLTQVFHHPVKEPGPVLVPDRPWEDVRVHIWSAPVLCSERSRWRMWYYGGEELLPLYAESEDGIHWEKPALGRVTWQGASDNNIVNLGFESRNPKENRIVLLRDDRDSDGGKRFKGMTRVSGHLRALISPDGLDWTPIDAQRVPSGDEYRLSYDARNHRFAATVKLGGNGGGRHAVPEFGRAVSLSTSEDFKTWSEPELIFWGDEIDQALGKERIDAAAQDENRRGPLVVKPDEFFTDVYNMPFFSYGDLYLGLPVMFNQSGVYFHSTGSNQDGILCSALVASRNLAQWHRLDRSPFIPHSPLSNAACWDYGMNQVCRPVVQGDELRFYYTGTRFTHLKRELIEKAGLRASPDEPMGGVFLARLRMDGFASLRAGDETGVVLTRSVEVAGKTLCVNADAAAGDLRVELRDAATGRAIPGYGMGDFVRDRYLYSEDGIERKMRMGTGARFDDDPVDNDTLPVRENAARIPIRWREKPDASELIERQVRVYIAMRNADLYSFWFE